jgi:hypothetical protein
MQKLYQFIRGSHESPTDDMSPTPILVLSGEAFTKRDVWKRGGKLCHHTYALTENESEKVRVG